MYVFVFIFARTHTLTTATAVYGQIYALSFLQPYYRTTSVCAFFRPTTPAALLDLTVKMRCVAVIRHKCPFQLRL